MKIKYRIDPIKRIITETWPKEVTIEDYKQVKQSEFNDPKFDPGFNVITDLRLLNLDLNIKIINGIINFINNNPSKFKSRKSAILTDKPNQVVNSFEFSSRAEKLPIKVKIFSTLEAVHYWLSEEVCA